MDASEPAAGPGAEIRRASPRLMAAGKPGRAGSACVARLMCWRRTRCGSDQAGFSIRCRTSIRTEPSTARRSARSHGQALPALDRGPRDASLNPSARRVAGVVSRLQRRIKRGTTRKAVCTYPSKKSLNAILGKVREAARRTRHKTLADLLRHLSPILRGWCGRRIDAAHDRMDRAGIARRGQHGFSTGCTASSCCAAWASRWSRSGRSWTAIPTRPFGRCCAGTIEARDSEATRPARSRTGGACLGSTSRAACWRVRHL